MSKSKISVAGGYPLQWPPGRPKVEPRWRDPSSFRQRTPGAAREFVIAEIERFGGDDVVISTNIPLRKDGLPYSGGYRLDDEAVAVYFTRRERRLCFACDRWATLAENYHAIGKTIEAIRGIDRWGSGDMMESAVGGFAALPAPTVARTWREVLGFERHPVMPSAELIRERYRSRVSSAHPDKGGSDAEMAELNAARAQALLECTS